MAVTFRLARSKARDGTTSWIGGVFVVTSLNRYPLILIAPMVAFLFLLLLCYGCNSASPPPKSVPGAHSISPTEPREDRLKASNGDEMASGDVSAAQFSARHTGHAGGVGQEIRRFGLVLRYPPDWQLNSGVPVQGPIALNTFDSHYSERGGHFPTHGAEIDISHFSRPKGSLLQLIQSDLQGSDELKIDELPYRVDGGMALRAGYCDSFKTYLAHKTVAIYTEHGDSLYKFFLTYHKGEPLGPEFTKDFEEIVKSVRFTD